MVTNAREILIKCIIYEMSISNKYILINHVSAEVKNVCDYIKF